MKGNFDLSPDEWATLRRLLDEGLERPADTRDAWLAGLEGDVAAFRPRLQALLAHADKPKSADGPTLATLPKIETLQFAPLPADAAYGACSQVGPYRLVQELGSGGMASVWLAERTDILKGRKVALKLPHGAWRRAGLAERLRREREILATLDHPNIARLYDAGVAEDGQPYLALEYVEGERIDGWCEASGADLAARIEIFLQVCDAVAYAHARLVVHRDLKPANILVDAAGRVKLLDFGIAKLLQGESAEETQLTQEVGRALTPDYAAPEQILGGPLGTAADLYSLGVVLFELLTGGRPYELARTTPGALEAAITGAAVPPPSERVLDRERRRMLRGDLDTIVLKALKKRPQDRYATVSAFADDLRRHLARKPVLARPDSRAYQWRLFVLRHRVAVGTGALLVAALSVGAGLALWQAAEARASRDEALQAQARAEAEAAIARRAQDFAWAQQELGDFLLMEMAARQPVQASVELLDRAAEVARKQYAGDASLRGQLLVDIAMRLRGVGEDGRVLALLAEAEPLLRGGAPPESLARLLCVRATHAARAGRRTEADSLMREVRPLLKRIEHNDHYVQTGCLLEEALIARSFGQSARAVELAEAAAAGEVRAGRRPRLFTSTVRLVQAQTYLAAGRYREAAAAAAEFSRLLEQLGQATTGTRLRAAALRAVALREGGRPLEALRAHGADGAFDPTQDPATLFQRSQYAETLGAVGRHDDALALLSQLEPLVRGQGNPADLRVLQARRAAVLVASNRLAAADRHLATAEAEAAAALAGHSFDTRLLRDARLQWALASGDLGRAEATLRALQATIERQKSDEPRTLRLAQRGAAQLALARGDGATALQYARQALEGSRHQAVEAAGSLWVAEDLLLLARAQTLLGEAAAVRDQAQLALQQAVHAAGPTHAVARQAEALLHTLPGMRP